MMFPKTASIFSVVLCAIQVSAAPPPAAKQYPIAKHVIPLYPPPIPLVGKFSADIKVGGQTLRAVVDTGSSDTWFMQEDTKCLDVTLQPVSPQKCGYGGARYTGSAFKRIPNTHMNISYGNHDLLNGPSGYIDLNFGGIAVPKQQISLPRFAAVGPEGNLSGLVGLAYPGTTLSYHGSDPSKDIECDPNKLPINKTCNRDVYANLPTTIFQEKLTNPIFALALSRSPTSGGVLTIGGIPKLDAPHVNATHGVQVTVPNEPLHREGNKNLTWYLADVEGLVYPHARKGAGDGQYVVDSGSSTLSVPAADAEAINAAFDPPAMHNKTLGYYVRCDAKAPPLGVQIGGKVFYVNPKDLALDPGPGYDGWCLSAVQPLISNLLPRILGMAWLKSVVAIFDVGKSEMTFISRMEYQV